MPATDQPSTSIPLANIDRIPGTFDVRGRIGGDHVELLRGVIDQLPPIDLVALGDGRYGILSGYHRLEAHRREERTTIQANVHDLPANDWFGFAVRSNITHGLPLTLPERRAAARRLLEADPSRSDRAIGRDTGLDHKTVAKLRTKPARWPTEPGHAPAPIASKPDLRVVPGDPPPRVRPRVGKSPAVARPSRAAQARASLARPAMPDPAPPPQPAPESLDPDTEHDQAVLDYDQFLWNLGRALLATENELDKAQRENNLGSASPHPELVKRIADLQSLLADLDRTNWPANLRPAPWVVAHRPPPLTAAHNRLRRRRPRPGGR